MGSTSLRAELIRGTTGTAVLVVLGRAMTLLTWVFLARLMGANGFGQYSTAVAIVALLGIPATIGLPILVVRLLPVYQLRGQLGLLKGLVRQSDRAVTVVSTAIAVLAAVALVFLSSGHVSREYTLVLITGLALLPLASLTAVRSAAVRGLGMVVRGQLPESLILPGAFLLGLLLWNVASPSGRSLSPMTAVFVRIAVSVMALVAASMLRALASPSTARSAPVEFDTRSWGRAAIPLLGLGGLAVVNTRADLLLVSLLRGPEAAGIFQAAARGADVAALFLVIVNTATQPIMSRLFASHDMARLQRLATSAARLAAGVATPTAIVFVLAGRPLLQAVFGVQFASGAPALAILASAQVVSAGIGSVGQLLTMTGHERSAVVGTAVGAGANIALNLVLIPRYGVTGAAIATALSLATWNIVLMVRVRRLLGIDPTALGLARP